MTNDLPDDADALARRAQEVLRAIEQSGMRVATAESCTGGLIASLLTDIEGLSRNFERGFVTYSEEAKCELLGIEPVFIARHGVVSREVALAMAEGALANSRADLALAVTGFAGPAGSHDEAGLVHLALVGRNGRPVTRECHFGDAVRDRVRFLTAQAALEMFAEVVGNGEDLGSTIAESLARHG
ncbi:MAG: CinA family protein [Novosphingobium sp.]|nr:CinA family protein [Novosphingobium sp.]